MSDNQPKQALYAAALEHYNAIGEVVHANIVYSHAPDQRTADISFRATYSREILAGTIRIVSVGLAVGFEVEDNHGEVLLAR